MIPLLEFEDIAKSFFGVLVLQGITFAVNPGRVLGLIGENGAGKSTLMNVLGGNFPPDQGRMNFRGSPYAPKSSRAARNAGIGFVHQELNLFPNLSIAENLFLTELPRRGPFLDRGKLRERAAELLAKVRLPLSPDTPVDRLSSGEQQLVEIARVLSFDARLIILDEPTTSLSGQDAERLFALVRALRAEGRSIIYISHALGDVLQLCDDIVVLRDGKIVATGARDEFDLARLVTLMVGRELKQLFPTRKNEVALDAENVLEVEGLTQPGIVRDISFNLHQGEILGVAGLVGAGRSELARILFGLDPWQRGTIKVSGEPLKGGPRRRIQQGVAFLTESRREDGLCLEASLADNLVLVSLPQHARGPVRWIDPKSLRAVLGRMREAVRIQSRLTDSQPVRTLSGGNQQKVVFGKWLLTNPKVLILDEPTRGIDVGAKREIYQLIVDRAEAGCAVLMISSEIEELTGLCDRLLVMRQGRIAADLPRARFHHEDIMRALLPEGVAT